jgi:hypothetical protein
MIYDIFDMIYYICDISYYMICDIPYYMWYMWYDMIGDMIYIIYDIYDVIYDKIWQYIKYDIWHDVT